MEAPADQDDYEFSFVDLFPSIFHAEDEVFEQSFPYISEGTITTLHVLKDFIAKHCDAKRYSFQIQKCTEETFTYCSINALRILNEVFDSLHFCHIPYWIQAHKSTNHLIRLMVKRQLILTSLL